MRLAAHSASAAPARDRRRFVRYPCAARVSAGERRGVTCDMSSIGLAFHTPDHFDPNEVVELCLSFDAAARPPLEVVHAAKVVWVESCQCAWEVGVEFLD
jgi:PilZ domain-containing protein